MFADERTAFEGELATSWTQTPVDYDNVGLNSPNGPWIRPTILGGESTQVTLGAGTKLHRRIGFCVIQVFVKEGTGTKVAGDLADALCDLFRTRKIGQITCGSPYPERVGKDGNGWFQTNVFIPFENEAQK